MAHDPSFSVVDFGSDLQVATLLVKTRTGILRNVVDCRRAIVFETSLVHQKASFIPSADIQFKDWGQNRTGLETCAKEC